MHRAPPDSATLHDVGLLLLRVFAGLGLALAHGLGKLPPSERFLAGVVEMGFPAAPVFAWAAGLSETVGGLLLAVGLLTRPAAFFVLLTMIVAAFVRQAGDPFLERELALLYGFVATQFLLTGAGRLSLDALLWRRREAAPAALAALFLLILAGCDPEPTRRAPASSAGPDGGLAGDYPEELRAGAHVLPGSLIAQGDSLYHGLIGPANCILCHGPFLQGGSHGTNLRDGIWHHGDGSYPSLLAITRSGVAQAVHSPIPRMPPMGGIALTVEQTRALAAYVYWSSHTRAAADAVSLPDGHEHADGGDHRSG